MFSICKRFLSRIEVLDRWFLALRLITIVVGAAWYLWVPYDAITRSIFGLLLAGFVAYTVVLYICIFLWPAKINGFYLFTQVVDLLFVFFLIKYVGQMLGSFFVAYYLLVGLHAFYFGPLVGLLAASVAASLYLYLYFDLGRPLFPSEIFLRISFLFLIAGSFGLLSVKERRNQEKIEKLNQELSHRNNVLTQVYRYLSIGKLAPGIAEKVNNPMAIIMGRAAVLKRDGQGRDLPGDVIEGLGVIYSQANQVASMFRDLVVLLTEGSVEPKRVDLNEIAKEALWLMEGKFEERHIEVAPEFSEDPSLIRGDAHELHEAIVHLLNNAVDALPQGGLVRVETFSDGQLSDPVLLKISDNGIGIRGDDKEKIFLPFFTTKEAGNGIGLGLSVALNIVKRHYGLISVQSEWGKGTTLTVSFPRYDSYGEVPL